MHGDSSTLPRNYHHQNPAYHPKVQQPGHGNNFHDPMMMGNNSTLTANSSVDIPHSNSNPAISDIPIGKIKFYFQNNLIFFQSCYRIKLACVLNISNYYMYLKGNYY